MIIKVPGINGNSNAKTSGNAILKKLKEIDINSVGKEIDFSKLDLEEIHLDDSNLKLTNKLIYENAFESYELYPKVFYLGGDGSISYSLARSFLDYCETNRKEACLIVFDSYLDCLPSTEFATNRNWLRKLIEEGFNPKNILLVGSRDFSKEEFSFLKSKGIRIVGVNQFLLNLENTCDSVMEFSNGKELYLSFDIKVLGEKFLDGISPREVLYFFSRVNKMKNLRALDIVEVDSKNFSEVSLGAKILSELV